MMQGTKKYLQAANKTKVKPVIQKVPQHFSQQVQPNGTLQKYLLELSKNYLHKKWPQEVSKKIYVSEKTDCIRKPVRE